jgi:hypothetical protein
MADVTANTTPRSAIRKRTDPLADLTAFDNLVLDPMEAGDGEKKT